MFLFLNGIYCFLFFCFLIWLFLLVWRLVIYGVGCCNLGYLMILLTFSNFSQKDFDFRPAKQRLHPILDLHVKFVVDC